jgi:GT2 family glycosyltransferase
MSFRRDALEAIGGFDVQYAGNALWEEIDAAFRLQNTGYSVRFAADAGVQHHRETNGGCRTGNNVWRLYCTFANTTYFAVTYAPRNHATAWLRYWWFRLEFLSRRDKPGWPRHAPLLVAAGGAGVAAGIIRHFLHGHRRALPEAVLRLHERVLRSAA